MPLSLPRRAAGTDCPARHGEALDFRKAGLMWLDGSAVPGGMTLRAVMPPRVLRKQKA